MLIFAHRGASGEFPENTILAIEKAISQGAHGIEFDVQQCSDDLAITHDRKISYAGLRQRVSNLSMQQLKSIALPESQRIPTLNEVLQTIDGRCMVNVELKEISDLATTKETLHRAITEYHFAPEQIIVSAFNHHILQTVSNWHLGIRIGALTATVPYGYAGFATYLKATSVHADINALSEAFVQDTRARGMQLFVYTVDDEDDIAQLIEWQVDGIFTNYPARSAEIVSNLTRSLK